MKITIVGLGYLGLPLARSLMSRGHTVSGTTTSVEKKIALQKQHIDAHVLRSPDLPQLQTDLLIINVPPFEGQAEWLKAWDVTTVGKIIFVSSTSADKDGPHSLILRAAEAWSKHSGLPWLIVRPGGLIGAGRHPGKHLSGKKALKGKNHPVNLIHVDDVIGFLEAAIEEDISGETIALVSDEHHSREEFYSEFCERAGLPLPEFDPADESTGPVVSNEAMKRYYQLKFPTMLGRSL